MKKIISTTLLLAAGTALATAASVTYSSSLYSTEDQTYYDATQIISSGKYASDITGDSNYTYNSSNAIYSADRANITSMSFLMSSLYTTYTGADTLYLTSFSIVTRDSALTDISNVTITISDSSGGVVATSTGVSADSNVSSSDVYGLATFSFDGTVALSTSTVYTVTFSGYSSTSGNASGFGVGAFKTNVSSGQGFGLNGSALTSQGDYAYNGNNNFQCVYSLTLSTTAVPEPSSFGLLAGLGALALVAARRRRRK